MEIKDHKLIAATGNLDISYDETPNHSGQLKQDLPDTIVIHYTGGASLGSSVNWLKNPQAKASAHLVVGKTGKIVQLAPFNVKTWHAGISKWKGRKNLNRYSIGIEIDNAGLLTKRADGYYTSFGKKVKENEVVFAKHKNEQEEKAWAAFTDKQIASIEDLCFLLKEQYNIVEIVGHDDIAPERKIDPGPAFPLQQISDRVLLGRNDEDEDGDEGEATDRNRTGPNGIVLADFLNIRSNPTIAAATVTDPLTRGTKLKILESKGKWSRVKVETEGWVVNKWVKKFDT